MAVLGFQLILTIVVLSVLNKLSSKYSFARWLLTKGDLIRYRHPSNERLKEAIAGSSADSGKINSSSSSSKNDQKASSSNNRSSRRRRHNQSEEKDKVETFTVPKNLTLTLDAEPLSIFYLIQLRYYSELQWLIDFSLHAVLVYFATELYHTLWPARAELEYNLSVVWCLLALGFSVKILLTITAMYFRGGAEAMSERSMCIMFGCIYFLVSMVVLIPNEELLEFGLIESYRSFSENALRLIEQQQATEKAYGPVSSLMFRFTLALWCGLLGALFTWPGMRVAKMHKDALAYAEGRKGLLTLYNLSFIAPLFVVLLWVKPVARHYLTVREWPNRGVLMTTETFEAARLLFVLFVIVLRLGLFRRYLQAFLNIAPQKLHYLNRESGKITNLDMQKLIAQVSSYLCIAALQFLTPLFLCLFLTLLTKSCGEYRWTAGLLEPSTGALNATTAASLDLPMSPLEPPPSLLNATESLLEDEFLETNGDNFTDALLNSSSSTLVNETLASSEQAQLTLALLRDVFNPVVLRGITGFLLWWTVTVWFSSAAIGFVYYSYFDGQQQAS